MGTQFGLDYLLKIGPPGGEDREFRPPQHIIFEVEQGVTRAIDKAKITLINLDDDDTTFLLQKNLRVILEAGYDSDGRGVIFAGQVAQRGVRATSVVTKRTGTDYVVEIEAGSGEVALQATRFDKSYAPGVRNLQIFDDIAAALAVKIVGREGIQSQTYQTGWTHSGTVSEALQELSDSIGVRFSIQGDDLMLLSDDAFLPERVSVVSPSTGLLGDAVRSVDGIEFESRLNYRLRPGRRIKLSAPGVKNGVYKISRLTHSGDNRGDAWVSRCFSRYTGGNA